MSNFKIQKSDVQMDERSGKAFTVQGRDVPLPVRNGVLRTAHSAMDMSHDRDKTFTAQRLDSAKSVGEGMKRTGPPRPSASNCSVPLVGDQTGALVSVTTGGDEPKNKKTMAERNKTQRTRPREENEARKEDTEMHGAWKKLIDLIEYAKEETKKLTAIVGANQNTRRDIKEAATVLTNIMAQMTTSEMKELMRTGQRQVSEDMKKTVDTCEMANQTDESSATTKERRNKTTQTEEDTCKNTMKKVTRQLLREVRNLEDYRRIKRLEWRSEYTIPGM